MEAQTSVALPLVLALELVAGETPSRVTLSRDEAAELAALVATDLHTLIPKVGEARLALAGALFDQVELLRPGFPVWATLDDLARRVPRGTLDNVVAFGAHAGQMPAPLLQPSPRYAEGALRLLPASLLAPAERAEELAEYMEMQLIGRGEAGVLTSDWLMRTLGIKLEHVRYLSRNDLLAMACVQYQHVNLAPLWTLLETALLTPDQRESVTSARGLSLHYENGAVLAQSPSQWLATQHGDETKRRHDFGGILFELRQYATLLDAHQLSLRLQPDDDHEVEADAGYILETLAAPQPGGNPPSLFAHEAPALGVVAISVAQPGAGGEMSVLAHGYPLQPQALQALLAELADRYGIASEVHALGQVWLDARGQLGAPAPVLH